jgi:hypothetical protein
VTWGDNPAARVRWFLESLAQRQFAALPDDTAPPPDINDDEFLADAAAKLLGVARPPEPTDLLPRLLAVAVQGRMATDAIGRLPPEAKAWIYLRHFDQVTAALQHLHEPYSVRVGTVLASIIETGWHALEMADDMLGEYYGEPAITQDDASRLLVRVRELIDEVSDATDLDDETQRRLIALLRDVEDALVDVRITGIHRVEEAADGLAGGLLGQEPDSWADKTLQKVGRFARELIMATVAATAAQLTANELTPPSQPPPSVLIIDYMIEYHSLPPALPPPDRKDHGPAAIEPPHR